MVILYGLTKWSAKVKNYLILKTYVNDFGFFFDLYGKIRDKLAIDYSDFTDYTASNLIFFRLIPRGA